MCSRTFSIIFALGFLAAGFMGAFHISVGPYDGPALTLTTGQGNLLGMFHVNLFHTVVNFLFGAMGIAACVKGADCSRFYAKLVGIVFVVLAILGAIPVTAIQTFFGLFPVEGNDIWLHTAMGVIACFVGFEERQSKTQATCSA